MTNRNEIRENKMNTLALCTVSHSTENWRIFNAHRPMRIKATTTGLQAVERERGREKEGSREKETHSRGEEKNTLIVLLLASLAGNDKHWKLCTFPHREEESWSKSCMSGYVHTSLLSSR